MTSQHGVNSNPPNQSPSMPQSDIRSEILKYHVDRKWNPEHQATKERVDDLMQLITNHTNAAVTAELEMVDPIASHKLAATVSDRLAQYKGGG